MLVKHVDVDWFMSRNIWFLLKIVMSAISLYAGRHVVKFASIIKYILPENIDQNRQLKFDLPFVCILNYMSPCWCGESEYNKQNCSSKGILC